MEHPLVGRIIVVEDEPLIALEIQQAFEYAGSHGCVSRTLATALSAVEDNSVSAAIVDHALGDGDSSEICERLKERGFPFVTYSGSPIFMARAPMASTSTNPRTRPC